MFQKKYFVIGSIIIYGFSLALFLILKEKLKAQDNNSGPCIWQGPCIRFCCDDKISCNEKFVKESFNTSVIPDYDEEYEAEVKFLLGSPSTCLFKNKVNANDFQKSWSFSYVSLSSNY